MRNILKTQPSLRSFGVPLLLFGIIILVLKSPLMNNSSLLGFAFTVDLVLLVPFVYFLLIRKTTIPKTTVVPILIIGVLIGSYFLPKEQQDYLTLFKTWILPLVELSVITIIILKVRKAIHSFKSVKGLSPDFFHTLQNACTEIIPQKLIKPFATEIAVFYYGFINWKTKPLAENEFSHHKNSGSLALFGVIILIIFGESIALHFLLTSWNNTVAWVLTGLSLYTLFQIFGFARSLPKRPISITTNSIILKYGIINEVEIRFSEIDQIEYSSKSLNEDKLTKTLSPLGEMEDHNVIIHLKSLHQLSGLYGTKKNFQDIGFFVDEPLTFKAKMEKMIPS